MALAATTNSAFIPDNINNYGISYAVPPGITQNAFLSKYWDPNIGHWITFVAPDNRDSSVAVPNNYWGTTSTILIDAAIYDFNDDFNKGRILYQPILTTPAESTYPFVWKMDITQGSSNNTTMLGPGLATFTVTFNRDMDTSVQPQVSFGPDTPVTDYTVHPVNGGWQSPRVWRGTFNINPITGDGYQLMRIAGPARAASDPWLVIGDDSGRFRFEIITSGTEAMNLQATGGEGYVDLMWTQDDFDMLAGYNLYRSTTADGSYTRLNSGVILASQKTYRDRNVLPGQPYFYQFTVVKTDMHESKFSNMASATPLDTIPPVIVHTPVSGAAVGSGLSISADVTDNVRVTAVNLYYRAIAETTYRSREMVNATGSRYSATLEGSLVVPPGLEYYVEATDGVSTVRSGRADLPYSVTVSDVAVVTAVSPAQGPTGGGTPATVSGSNFKAGASVTFGGAVASNVTLVSANQITALTPPHLPGTVDVAVTNPGSASGTLLRAFTYRSSAVPVSLPDIVAPRNAIIRVPVSVSNVEGLLAAHLIVRFNGGVLAVQGVRNGTLTAGFSAAANTATPGEISVSLASGSAVSGSGTLATFDLLVTGAPGSSSSLTLAGATLNDGAIPVIPDDGTFRVQDLLSLSGTVGYYNAGLPVSNVTLALSGDGVMSQVTGAAGSYTLSGIAPGSYTLTPQKSDSTSAISAYDASLILQASVGLGGLTAQQRMAADVDRSDNVTPMDAAYVLQKSAQLIDVPFPGAGKVWEFEPASRMYQPLTASLIGQSFTAILIGDVSGNWGRSRVSASGPTVKVPAAELSVTVVPAAPSSQVTVPLYLVPQGHQVYSLDLVLTYDPSVVSAVRAGR